MPAAESEPTMPSPGATSVDEAGVRRFARGWGRGILGVGFVPLSVAETEERLTELARIMATALVTEPFESDAAYRVGEALVTANFTDAVVLETTLRSVATELAGSCLSDPAYAASDECRRRLMESQVRLAAGYARALRRRTMTEQEQLSRSILDALWASEARFRAVFVGSATGIALADLNGCIVDANHSFADMMGYSLGELHKMSIMDFRPASDPETVERYRQLIAGQRDHLRLESTVHRKDGSAIWVDLTASLIRDESGQPSYTAATVTDITERHFLQVRLRHQALHDPLTGLPNRRFFAQQLAAAFAAAAPDTRIGMCFLDLDRFKYVNDSLGHEVGDRLLVTIAHRLDECATAQGHLVARMGGDEFVILVARSEGVEQLVSLAKEVAAAVAEPVYIGTHRLRVTASIGIVEQQAASTVPTAITQAGDITLQWAKTEGRGRWALFDPTRHAELASRYRLAAALADAIEANEFVLEYQPLVQLSDGGIRGVEALVRWRHPRLGLLPPDQFIGLAEDTGLIVPLGLWILRTACHQAARWCRERPAGDLFVSVNLAVAQILEPTLVNDIAEVLREAGLEPGRLQLEITESAMTATSGQPLETLHQLAAMGVRIAIDDFGTGYSNLAYLRSLPVHALKLAGTFIDGLRHADERERDLMDEQIVDNLIRLAHAIGLTVTAEAVETAAQADRLALLGCDLAQGWYVSRAMSAEDFERVLRQPPAPPTT